MDEIGIVCKQASWDKSILISSESPRKLRCVLTQLQPRGCDAAQTAVEGHPARRLRLTACVLQRTQSSDALMKSQETHVSRERTSPAFYFRFVEPCSHRLQPRLVSSPDVSAHAPDLFPLFDLGAQGETSVPESFWRHDASFLPEPTGQRMDEKKITLAHRGVLIGVVTFSEARGKRKKREGINARAGSSYAMYF